MKKILLGFTAFILILTGCQKSEVVENINDGNNQLDFGVYQGKATRTGELTNAELNIGGVNFPLCAYKGKKGADRDSYFEEVLTFGTPVPNKWNTSIPRFLTANDPLQFYAYYAKGAVGGVVPGVTSLAFPSKLSGANAYPTFVYQIQPTLADLVAATVEDHSGTSVTIPFRHILSQVNFGVKGYYGAQIEISDIKINGVNNKGTFSFNPAVTEWGWKGQTGTTAYDYTFPGYKTPGSFTDASNAEKESDLTYVFGDGGQWGPGEGDNTWYVTAAGVATQGSKVTTPLANSLILMPQALAAGKTVTFKYTIQDLENKFVVGAKDAPVAGKFDLALDATAPYANKWQPNLRYVYIIDFTGYLDGQLLSFTVDVETNQWENYDKPGDGIVLLSSVGEPMFKDKIQGLEPNTGTYAIPLGHVFSDIAWDWSPYGMTKTFAAGNTFTVTFANVKFNGNSITVTAPDGFEVSNDNTTFAASAKVTSPNQTLTFKKTVTLP